MLVATRVNGPTNHGGGNSGIPGTVTVSVTMLVLTDTVVVVVVVVVGEVVVVVVVVGSVVVVVVGEDVVVVSVVGEVVVAVVVVAAVRDVVVIGVTCVLSESEPPPKIRKTISTKSSAPMTPNATSAHGLRYHGTGGSSGGPGGSPGGCWPYPLYAVGWSE